MQLASLWSSITWQKQLGTADICTFFLQYGVLHVCPCFACAWIFYYTRSIWMEAGHCVSVKRYIHNQVKSQDKFKYTQMIKKRINQPVCKLHFI